MLTRTTRRSCGLLAASAITAALLGCAADPQVDPTTPAPTMAPEQSVAEACGVSSASVDALVQQAKEQIEAAGTSLVAGEIPDLSALGGTLSGSLDTIGSEITNSEVSSALGEVRAAVDGFGDIARPDSLLAVPGYLTDLGAQLSALQDAGSRLQQLCNAG